MPRNSILRPPPPPPVMAMMKPNQVEIISKDKRPDEKFSASSNVLAITPKSVSKKFVTRHAKSSSPRGKRGNITIFHCTYLYYANLSVKLQVITLKFLSCVFFFKLIILVHGDLVGGHVGVIWGVFMG